MIRRLTLEDRDAFRALRQAALESHPEAYATSGEDWKKAPDEKIDALLQGSVDGGLPMFGYFAPEPAGLVGMVGLRLESEASTSHKAMVWGVFVQPDWQRQGVGRSLMEHAIEEAQANPQLEMLLLVFTTDNTAAFRLFESCGFCSYGTEPDARLVDGIYYDQVFQYRLV